MKAIDALLWCAETVMVPVWLAEDAVGASLRRAGLSLPPWWDGEDSSSPIPPKGER